MTGQKKWSDRGNEIVDPPCPRCGGLAVYNGNYFCEDCDWSLSEEGEVVWFRMAYASLMRKRRLT